MKLAGERNFKPVSIFSGLDALKKHWETYSEANIKAGFTPDRQRPRRFADSLLRRYGCRSQASRDGGPDRLLLQSLSDSDLAALRHDDGFAKDAGIDPLDADLEFLVDNVFVVGSPDTVVEKLSHLFEQCGGWARFRSRRTIIMMIRRPGSNPSSSYRKKLRLGSRYLAHDIQNN